MPEGRKKWLQGRLYNQPTLKERLIDLASIPDPDIMNRLLPNPKKWAKNAALARNGIAHRGRHNTTEYIPVVQVTTAVLIVNLLQLLGVPKDRVLRALSKTQRCVTRRGSRSCTGRRRTAASSLSLAPLGFRSSCRASPHSTVLARPDTNKI